MRAQMEARLPKWPFLLGDALMVGTAWFVFSQSKLPMGPWQMGFVVVCVAAGAVLALIPFLLEYRVAAKLVEGERLATAVEEIRKLQALAAQIGDATGKWQTAQEHAGKTVASAAAIAERMSQEVKGFSEFMQKVNDSEKAALRLEVEKSKRGETEWLQVVVRMLDHVHALHAGAVRSGQPSLIENLTNFQNACRDTARRVGLTPFQPAPAEPFDASRHQVVNGHTPPPSDSLVGETVASGYTFQGRLLRPALVRLKNGVEPTDQGQLALDAKAAEG